MLGLSLENILISLTAVLIALTFHELAHAFVALRLGDDTAKLQGRVTLNPLRHIDPVGLILLVVAGFGWAKPVMIDRTKLKKPVRDDILIALAGPASNAILAAVVILALKVVVELVTFESRAAFRLVTGILLTNVSINVSLALFNLLPIPPLDGSHVITNLLFRRAPAAAATYFRYGSFALLALVLVDNFTKVDILPIGRAVNAVVRALLGLVGLA